MDQLKNMTRTKEMYNYELPNHQNPGCQTERVSRTSSVSPNKTKRSLIKINQKKLPQDFFKLGTSKIYNQQLANKLNLSPERKSKPDISEKEKLKEDDKEESKGIWLPNFGEQMLFGDQSVMISEDNNLDLIRGRFVRGGMKTHQECDSPVTPFRTIGAMTPCPSTGHGYDSPKIDPSSMFQWTFSRDMYSSTSPTKQYEQKAKKQVVRRGGSLKERNLADSLFTKSCEEDLSQYLNFKMKGRKPSIGNNAGVGTLFPKISKKQY